MLSQLLTFLFLISDVRGFVLVGQINHDPIFTAQIQRLWEEGQLGRITTVIKKKCHKA